MKNPHQTTIRIIYSTFFIWYGIEYVIKFLYYRNSNLAYRNISFEREAYLYENDLSYLKTRSFFGPFTS
jgi:hypothetical protein